MSQWSNGTHPQGVEHNCQACEQTNVMYYYWEDLNISIIKYNKTNDFFFHFPSSWFNVCFVRKVIQNHANTNTNNLHIITKITESLNIKR